MTNLEHVRCYIDDVLIIHKESLNDCLYKLKSVFTRLREAGLKVNAKKSFFAKPELEYLWLLITQNSLQPIPRKVDAILNLSELKILTELRRFIGLINY
jgi:hypothetical protein